MCGGDPAALLSLALTDGETFDAIWYAYLPPNQGTDADQQAELDRAIAKSRGRL